MKKQKDISDQYLNAISRALQKKRIELGFSQDELSEKAELHRTYVSLIERTSCNFSMKIFMRLALALDLEPATLMANAEDIVNSRRATGSARRRLS